MNSPQFIDPRSIYTGPPTQCTIDAIRERTFVDERGFRYYRRNTWEGWRRLRTEQDFGDLNRIIEPFRQPDGTVVRQ